MPRNPNPDTKDQQAYIRAKTTEEKTKIKAAKEICARNPELNIRSVLLEGIEAFLKKHNWPPGNSQTVLPGFGKGPIANACGCGQPAEIRAFLKGGGERFLCRSCRRAKPGRYTGFTKLKRDGR